MQGDDLARLYRLEAAGGSLRWYRADVDGQPQHFLHGVAHGIPIVGAGPIADPPDPAQLQKAAHDAIERVATVLGVLEG